MCLGTILCLLVSRLAEDINVEAKGYCYGQAESFILPRLRCGLVKGKNKLLVDHASRENTSLALKVLKFPAKAEIEAKNHVAMLSGDEIATKSVKDETITILALRKQRIVLL